MNTNETANIKHPIATHHPRICGHGLQIYPAKFQKIDQIDEPGRGAVKKYEASQIV